MFFHSFQVKLTDITMQNAQLKESIVKSIAKVLEGSDETFDNEIIKEMDLSVEDEKQLFDGIQRIKSLADFSVKNNLRLLVDAEYTYMNEG